MGDYSVPRVPMLTIILKVTFIFPHTCKMCLVTFILVPFCHIIFIIYLYSSIAIIKFK